MQPYQQYWFVTITPYGKEIEPNVPDKEKVIESFQKLLQEVDIDSIGWRYDPIFIGMGFSVKRHIEAFEKMAKAFSRIGKENGMTIHACCEKTYLEEYGIDCKGCMTQEIIEKDITLYLRF